MVDDLSPVVNFDLLALSLSLLGAREFLSGSYLPVTR